MFGNVDANAKHLTREESVAIHMMQDKYERYISKGLLREAQGMKSGILILWQALGGTTSIDTGWGEI